MCSAVHCKQHCTRYIFLEKNGMHSTVDSRHRYRFSGASEPKSRTMLRARSNNTNVNTVWGAVRANRGTLPFQSADRPSMRTTLDTQSMIPVYSCPSLMYLRNHQPGDGAQRSVSSMAPNYVHAARNHISWGGNYNNCHGGEQRAQCLRDTLIREAPLPVCDHRLGTVVRSDLRTASNPNAQDLRAHAAAEAPPTCTTTTACVPWSAARAASNHSFACLTFSAGDAL